MISTHPPLVHRVFGVLCLLLTVLGWFALLHHPTLSGTNTTELQASLQRVYRPLIWVHAGMIAVSMLLAICMSHYSHWRAARSSSGAWNAAANVIYSFATLGMCLAALINGFVAPTWLEGLPPDASHAGIARVLWVLNQKLTLWSGLSMFAAICCWAQDWCWDSALGIKQRLFGAVLTCLAVFGARWLVGQSAKLDVHVMQMLWLIVSAWFIAAALALITVKLDSQE
jgi:hypothetical protein